MIAYFHNQVNTYFVTFSSKMKAKFKNLFFSSSIIFEDFEYT